MVATKQSNEVTDEAAVAQEQGKSEAILLLGQGSERGRVSMAGRYSSPIYRWDYWAPWESNRCSFLSMPSTAVLRAPGVATAAIASRGR